MQRCHKTMIANTQVVHYPAVAESAASSSSNSSQAASLFSSELMVATTLRLCVCCREESEKRSSRSKWTSWSLDTCWKNLVLSPFLTDTQAWHSRHTMDLGLVNSDNIVEVLSLARSTYN